MWKILSISEPASGSNSWVSLEFVTGLRSWVLLGHRFSTLETIVHAFDSLELDMSQAGVGDVPDEDPADLEHALPLIGRPNCAASGVIDRGQHLCHAAEMSRCIDAEEEVDRPTTGGFLERLVETLVSRIC